jgi:hypothetical protein
MSEMQKQSGYDIPTAVTFLVIGLAVGSFLSSLISSIKEVSASHERRAFD